ncbi:MAG: alpha-mannosidase [Clostridia bacterium]|nr:alpha-mannosidase [Clostridia bacterium]
MAHIKVTRRSMRPEEYTDLRFGWLKRSIYEDKTEITSFTIREARQTSEMKFEFYDAEPRMLNKGDMYFSPDGTAFIEAYAKVPEKYKGKEVRFCLKTAAEMIVKINGKYAGGIDPNRENLIIPQFIDSDEIHIEITAYNRSKPDDERNPESLSVRGCRQVFEGGYFGIINESVQSLVYDLELLLDISKSECFNEDLRHHINKELYAALDYIDFDNICNDDVLLASEHIRKHIYADNRFKGNGKVALISHSHLDIAYYWRRIHTVQKNLRTVLIQMRLMDKYPDFRYAHTQAYTYETIEKYYPEVFEELKEKIRNKQFEPVGAMYVEPDCNVPSAESLIRQCLYGQMYYREKFGVTVDSCWLPDVFGNSWILPQILKKSGVKYFVSNKMSTWNDTNRFPHNNFIWKGIDGSKIYACVPPTHFISWNMPSQVQENWDAFQDKESGTETLQMFGYGDGGSGVTEEMIELMHRFEKISAMPETRHITAHEFLEENFTEDKNFAVWDGELYLEMHRGTFTTKSEIKRYNRLLEYKLRDAEIVSVAKMIEGNSYPADTIKNSYKKLLINQFHDILPGSHITPVNRDAIDDYKEIESDVEKIIECDSRYFFNSLNFARNSITFIEDTNGDITRLGKKGFYTIPGIDSLQSAEIVKSYFKDEWLNIDNTVETPYYSIKFNNDGSFESLYDKKLDRNWIKGNFNKLHLYYDYPGVYDAWDILPDYANKEEKINIDSPVILTYKNNETAEFTTVLSTKKSKWKMIIRVFRRSRAIEVENIVDWNEKHRLAKVEFSPDILSRELVCDTSAGFIKREMHKNTTWQQARFETCHHKWFDISETDAGVAVINNSKYGVGIGDDSVTLSLLRATIRPDPTSDIGHHEFTYMILPHEGDAVHAKINNIAFEYNIPLLKQNINMNINFGDLYLQGLKLSEDSEYIIIRLSEQNGKRGILKDIGEFTVMNMLEDIEYTAKEYHYKPFEIITIGIRTEDFGKYVSINN